VARWLLRDNLGCDVGSILSGEKSEIRCLLTELWCFGFFFFLDFGAFLKNAPDDRPGTDGCGSGW
jgi:hypothetical protein